MRSWNKSVAAAAVTAMLLTCAVPVRAEDHAKGRSAGTVVKWALIGAAAGAGIGFLAGFHAYDDAAFAESKIGKATVAGGAIGAGAGLAIGLARSRPSTPRADAQPSLWRPDTPVQMTRRPAAVRLSWPTAAGAASRH